MHPTLVLWLTWLITVAALWGMETLMPSSPEVPRYIITIIMAVVFGVPIALISMCIPSAQREEQERKRKGS